MAAFEMGASRAPDGREISVNSNSLLRDGKPWLAVMGEIHFSRYPASEWRDALRAMKAGGVDVVASYVFWIHHEEIEGEFDFNGQRDLRRFAQTCREVGLPLIVRCGPWCHGEARNGGLPDWILPLKKRLRTEDPEFIARVRILYANIAKQLSGLLWKDGGPVIGIQLDNEYSGPASYLLELKKIAREAGLDVPIYTRTGWPNLTTKMPPGQMLPLYGGYAEGFWDRSLDAMPGKYWRAFRFEPTRTDSAIATDQFGNRLDQDDEDARHYPYLTCELGGGMMTSYHRRIRIDPRDIAAVALVKLGSGSNLPGYYMYHGGTNPEGKRSTLHESQATGYPNDLPVKSYDFQAPLGEFGQVRPHYHLLRRMHLFLHDFGEELAVMKAFFPDKLPVDEKDNQTLRYAIRSDGNSGFIFVNNFHRLLPMPPRKDVQFDLSAAGLRVCVPHQPFTIPADSSFFWPVNLELNGSRLLYATAQPVCKITTGDAMYVVFAQIPGVRPEFVFDERTTLVQSSHLDDPGTHVALEAHSIGDGRKLRVIVLGDEASLQCYRATIDGQERILLSKAQVIVDEDRIVLRSTDPKDLSVAIFPPLRLEGVADGIFSRHRPVIQPHDLPAVSSELIQQAGPPRVVPLGAAKQAEAPDDEAFAQAAVWKITLPPLDPARRFLLRAHYFGDVARFELDGKILTDNFYNGTPFDLGLWRVPIKRGGTTLLLKILPLRKDAPIHITPGAAPAFMNQSSILELRGLELIELRQAVLNVR